MHGIMGPLKNIFSFDNILVDPTRTPIAVPFLALSGYALLWRSRPRLAVAMTIVLLAIVPVSFVVRESRGDAIRYQGLTLWVFYLLAAVFSESHFCAAA